MLIWHHGAGTSCNAIGGVNRVVWMVAREQSRQGHDVTLLLDDEPQADAVACAVAHGITLRRCPPAASLLKLRTIAELGVPRLPDIVHLHSVFVPRQALLGRVLRRSGIPYVISPHGGLMLTSLRRSWIRKRVYAALLERSHMCGASAIGAVLPLEERHVRTFVPGYGGPISWLPNPADVSTVGDRIWKPPLGRSRRRLVFLGRMDVWVKGLDLLVATARYLPEVNFELYGERDAAHARSLQRLLRHAPGNVSVHASVHGEDKARVLLGAAGYIQMSRTEGFSLSVVDAMWAGVPCAINQTMSMAELFAEHRLGLLVPPEPAAGARCLAQWLEDQPGQQAMANQARQFAIQHFSPPLVARRYAEFYKVALDWHAGAVRREARAGVAGVLPQHAANEEG